MLRKFSHRLTISFVGIIVMMLSMVVCIHQKRDIDTIQFSSSTQYGLSDDDANNKSETISFCRINRYRQDCWAVRHKYLILRLPNELLRFPLGIHIFSRMLHGCIVVSTLLCSVIFPLLFTITYLTTSVGHVTITFSHCVEY